MTPYRLPHRCCLPESRYYLRRRCKLIRTICTGRHPSAKLPRKTMPPLHTAGTITPQAGRFGPLSIFRFCYKQLICLSSISLWEFPYTVAIVSIRCFPALRDNFPIHGLPPFPGGMSLKAYRLNPGRCTALIKIPPAYSVFRGRLQARSGFLNACGKKRSVNTI